jgi:hypothetical protein
LRDRETILEGIMTKEVKIQGKTMYHKQIDPIKLQLAILETLANIQELLTKKEGEIING